jgi:hypothetical protein
LVIWLAVGFSGTVRVEAPNYISAAFCSLILDLTRETCVEHCASFFDSDRAAVLNVRPVDVILVKKNVVELALVDHFSASAASVEVAFRRVTQLIKFSGIQELIALR